MCVGSSPTFTGECQEGYYCRLGAFTPTPTDGDTGEECPEGHYCVSGTVAPESCPSGTFSNSLGLTIIDNCTDCTPGMFCNGTALTAPSGDCWPRYYCSGKAEHPAPQDGNTGGNCTPGHYCPGKTPAPIPCEVIWHSRMQKLENLSLPCNCSTNALNVSYSNSYVALDHKFTSMNIFFSYMLHSNGNSNLQIYFLFSFFLNSLGWHVYERSSC